MQRLREGVEERRLHRLESSESILQDARARLEALQKSVRMAAMDSSVHMAHIWAAYRPDRTDSGERDHQISPLSCGRQRRS